METLLIVLVIGCALAFVVQVGRGIWARARTVERHQQALDTLAGLTQRPEESEDSFAGPYEHQAHVRLIGPGAQGGSGDAALPPPRALPSSGSSFRRPSRSIAAGAALEPAAFEASWAEAVPIEAGPVEPVPAHSVQIDVTAVPASFTGPETGPVLPVGPPPPPVLSSVSTEAAQRTMPGLPAQPAQVPQTPHQAQPQPPAVFVEPPTVPVPIVQPQVFYFDDLSSHSEAPDREGHKPRRLGRRRRRSEVTAEHLLPALPPPPVSGVSDKAPAAGRGPKGRRKSVVGVVLAAAAICVAVAAIGLTIVGLPGSSTPGAQNAAKTGPPSSATHHATSTSVPSKSPTTTAAPSKPAVLVSTQNGTATYELSSASASIVVSASGPCWLEVRANSPLGQIVYEGTLEAGVHFSVTGPAWIRVGNPPAVAVKVNGTPMTVPGSQLAVPVNLQFTFG
jgi:RodZ C-terminal domain